MIAQRKSFRVAYIFMFSFLMLHLPFSFSTTAGSMAFSPLVSTYPSAEKMNKEESNAAIFENMDLGMKGLSEEAFFTAMKGFDRLVETGKIHNDHLITIVDFTRPSSQKRIFVIDLDEQKVLFHTYVAHGQGSGKEYANMFSNTPESYQSSLGFYETTSTYMGKNGFSLKLKGLENGINDNAEERAVVMHGAPYVSESFIHARGYLGRSWGCPALPENLNKPIINKIKNGSCLFIYSRNNTYLKRSKIINS